MAFDVKRFPPQQEAAFRAARLAALAEINVTTFWLGAILVMAFSWWDWFVDPVNWRMAFAIRAFGVLVILATGIVQKIFQRPDHAAMIAKVRFAATVLSVAGALSVLDDGYIVGLAGLVAALLSAPYIALDRRDLMLMNIVPLAGIGLLMAVAGLDRFAVINASIFILLSIAVSLLLARVFEASNRRAFMLEHQLSREARTDSLTDLRNRRAIEEAAGIELKRSSRDNLPLSVILCDIDHFKQVNDRYGHDVGDRVITAVAKHLSSVVRDTDALGRWGGEEFLAILPNTSEDEAALLAERMRAVVERAALPIHTGFHVTLSFGVAGVAVVDGADSARWNNLVKAADNAMYRAKEGGRNRVVVAGSSVSARPN